MARGQFSGVLRHLRIGRQAAGAQDAELLERFVERRDEEAFAALLKHHGPMVLGVCRRLLGNAHDAEDAFQATFLVLARKAESIRGRGALAGWLYRVAYRAALASRAACGRQRALERQVASMQSREQTDPTAEVAWRDLQLVLDEELTRLPEKYRLAVVLCSLEGKTHEEAANELGCPRGTLAARLARAKELLRGRLARRGLALSAVLLSALLAEQAAPAAVPAAVLKGTLNASIRFAGAPAGEWATAPAKLAERMLQTMHASKLKVVALFVLLSLTAGGTAALLESAAPDKAPPPRLGRMASKWPRLDSVGDPLPPGALARLGTTRLHHAGNLYGPAFSPDGKTFVTGDGYGLVRLWDVATGKELRRFAEPGKHYFQLGIVSGGKVVATVGLDGLLRRWELASGKSLPSLQLGESCPLTVFSPNGKWLAMGYGKNVGQLRLFDVANGKAIHRLPRLGEWQAALAFSPDSQRLAAGGGDHFEIWDVRTGKLVHQSGKGAVSCLAFSSDGKTLATAGPKGQPISLWDVATGKARAFPVAVQHGVTSLAFSSDDRTLFVGAEDATLALDVATGKEKHRLGKNHFGFRVVLSPDGKVLALAGWGNGLQLRDARTLEPLLRFPGHSSWVNSVAYAPDSKVVVTGGGDGTARLWDVATGRELRCFKGGDGVQKVAFSLDGKLLLAGCGDAVRIWEVAGGKQVAMLRGCYNPAFSPDSKLVAAAEKGKSCLVLWEPRSGKVVRRLGPVGMGTDTLFAVTFAPDGKTVAAVLRETRPGASTEGDAVVYLWDVASGKERRTLTREQFGVRSLAFSPDGRTLAAGTEQGTLHFWDVTTGKEERVLSLHHYQVYALAFSPDGRTVATAGGEDCKVRLWEVLSGRERRHFPGHIPNVVDVAFAPDGRTVASASEDGTALVWDLADPGHGPR